MLLGVTALLLTLPATQTFIAKKVVNYLNEDFDIDLNIERIHLKINGDVDIKRVLIRDHKQDTLISAKKLTTSILDFKQLFDGNLYFGHIKGDSLIFNMKTHKGDTLSNLDVFVNKFDSGEPSTGKFVMKAKSIKLKDSYCRISDENNANPSILKVDHLNTKLNDFKILGSKVFFEMQEGNFRFDDKLNVTHLNTQFSYTDSLMQAKDLRLQTALTDIQGTITMFSHNGSFGDFVNKVVFDVNLPKATVNTTDLNAFYNGFNGGRNIVLEGVTMKGTLNNFTIPQGKISYQNTLIEGDLTFQNLLAKHANIAVIGKGVYAESIYNDLAYLMPKDLGENIPAELQRLGMFSVEGDFAYRTTSLQANVLLKTNDGEAHIDGSLEDLTHTDKTAFRGTLTTNQFHLGKI